MCAAGLVGSARPAVITSVASWAVAYKRWRITAVVARIAIGAVLIVASGQTPYPLALKIIGVVAIMGGTAVALVGEDVIDRWTKKIAENTLLTRALCLTSLLVGAFLIHATTR